MHDDPSAPSPADALSRRTFLLHSAATIALGHPLVASLGRSTPAARTRAARITLKSAAEYQADAAQFEAATRSLATAAAIAITSAAAKRQVAQQVAVASQKLALHHSWMVATAMADSALQTWVRKELRDQAALEKFHKQVMENPKIVDAIPGMAALRTKLAQQTAAARTTLQQIVAKELAIVGVSSDPQRLSDLANAMIKAGSPAVRECQQTWAVVAAVTVVSVAVIAATLTIAAGAALTAAAVAGAAALAARYASTGAEQSAAQMEAASQRYQQCVVAANLQPPDKRDAAIADCQAKLMQEVSAAAFA